MKHSCKDMYWIQLNKTKQYTIFYQNQVNMRRASTYDFENLCLNIMLTITLI